VSPSAGAPRFDGASPPAVDCLIDPATTPRAVGLGLDLWFSTGSGDALDDSAGVATNFALGRLLPRKRPWDPVCENGRDGEPGGDRSEDHGSKD
jgi:hypothetical protein